MGERFIQASVCRLCVKEGGQYSLFIEQNSLTPAQRIMSLTDIKVSRTDGLPQTICIKCRRLLNLSHEFKIQIENVDLTLRATLPCAGEASDATVQENAETSALMDNVKVLPLENAQESVVSQDEGLRDDFETEELRKENDSLAKEKGNGSIYVCDNCNQTLRSRKSFTKHISKCGKIKSEKIKNKTEPERSFICEVCGARLGTLAALRTHGSAHAPRACSCALCGATFARRDNLRDHLHRHRDNKRCVCERCGRRFTRASELARHRRVHSERRAYACDLCAATFKRSHDRTNHMRVHTGQRPFKCDQCDKTYKSRSGLVKHRLVHSRPGGLPTSAEPDINVVTTENTVNTFTKDSYTNKADKDFIREKYSEDKNIETNTECENRGDDLVNVFSKDSENCDDIKRWDNPKTYYMITGMGLENSLNTDTVISKSVVTDNLNESVVMENSEPTATVELRNNEVVIIYT